MSSQTPIPVALCASDPKIIGYVSQYLLPEYEIVHVSQTLASSLDELPRLLNREPILPASGVGTLSGLHSQTSPVPEVKAIIVGSGFPPPAFDEIRKTCEAVKPVPWIRADPKTLVLGKPPNKEDLAARVKRTLDERRDVGSWEGGLYLF